MNQLLAFDPFCKPEVAAAFGVKLVSLDELCKHADFMSVHCPLNDSTRGLIGKEQFDLMKDGYVPACLPAWPACLACLACLRGRQVRSPWGAAVCGVWFGGALV